ncbi:MBL fold metallo-hydrolase [Candidatus Kaiserbacteria bacterium]|nr:MBL fold metallo-hydrolase [Candidatus Kaiserbacteria bacterium]
MSTLGFYGGVGSVTGANFMLDTGETAILVDCGLIQGDRFAMAANADPFPYNPADADILLVTHAHADHIGRIPKLVRDGFRGAIYSTEPTKALAAVMLKDAYKVVLYEEERFGIDRLYEEGDIDAALALWKTVSYHQNLELPDGVTAVFKNVGHILGSASITLSRGGKQLVFTGDIGNVPQPLLDAPDVPQGYDYMVMESVYGDRSHEEVKERTMLLKHHIEAAQRRGGTLIIPAFSLERTQGMLLEINDLVESGAIAPIPTFLDSPLAIAVTELYRTYSEYLSTHIQEQIKAGDDIFEFPKLEFTRTVKDSQDIAKVKGAKIIIAGSGMSHGGRILMHEKRYLEDKNTTLLLVGYQSVGSLGRLLQDGAKKVRIDNADVRVRAEIARIRGYSGHADREQLTDFVAKGGDRAKQIFVTMGEEHSSLFLVQRLRDYLGVNAVAPSLNEEVEIEF